MNRDLQGTFIMSPIYYSYEAGRKSPNFTKQKFGAQFRVQNFHESVFCERAGYKKRAFIVLSEGQLGLSFIKRDGEPCALTGLIGLTGRDLKRKIDR